MTVFKFFLANVYAGFWCPIHFIASGVFGLLYAWFPTPKLRHCSRISCLVNLGIFYVIVLLIGIVGAAADNDVSENKIRILPHMLNIFLGLCGFMAAFIQATTIGWDVKDWRQQNLPNQPLEMVAMQSQSGGFHTNLHVPECQSAAPPITPSSPALSSFHQDAGATSTRPSVPLGLEGVRAPAIGEGENCGQTCAGHYNCNQNNGFGAGECVSAMSIYERAISD
jgi:hypothetical protein